MKNRYLVIVGAAIIVAVVAGASFMRRGPAGQPAGNGARPGPSQPAAASANAIKFSGQGKIEIAKTVSATDHLTFGKILMPGNGFVVVKDRSGKIVGASNLIAFPETDAFRTGIAVKAGQSYVAELHGDDGDGVFDPKADPPIVIGGKAVTADFKAK